MLSLVRYHSDQPTVCYESCEQGEVLGNLRHGNGTYVRADGSKYSGQWRYDALEGVATAITADGQTYTGEWRAGKAAGYVGVYNYLPLTSYTQGLIGNQ